MTTVAISGLPVATVINAADIVPFVQAGTTKSISKTLLFTSPALVTPAITNPTVTTGTFTSPALVTPALGIPSSGTVTNLTGTASININGTVGATTPATGAFTTASATTSVTTPSVITSGATALLLRPNGVTRMTVGADGDPITTAAPLAVTGALSTTTTIATGGYTVATLPAGTVGQRAYVTDATAPAYNTALTGGGSVTIPVFRNATIWVSA